MLADGVLHLAGLGLVISARVPVSCSRKSSASNSTGGTLGLMPRLIKCSLIKRFTFSPASPRSRAFVLIALLGHPQNIAKAFGRHPVGLRGRMGQNNVHAHQELLQVDLEVRPATCYPSMRVTAACTTAASASASASRLHKSSYLATQGLKVESAVDSALPIPAARR